MSKTFIYLLLPGALLLSGYIDLRAGSSSKNIVAAAMTTPISIDGYLNEPAWINAVPVTSFEQYEPDEGAPPTEATSVRVLYDDRALYIGVICYDADPSGIIEQLTRRDRTPQADRFSVMIDSYHDHRTAFLFAGSVSGVQSDGVLSNDGLAYDVQWDAVWDFAAQMIHEGWSAEFMIPYNAIRFTPQDSEYVWGINFRRYVARKKEVDEWVMVPRSEAPPQTISSVSQMGHLSGIRSVRPPLHIEILPHLVSKYSSLPRVAPFDPDRRLTATGGVDLKYGVTNSITIDAAINPDFGQVEVDQAVLNLTVFETFYPEKRPFFLEASQIFSFGNSVDNQPLRLFYSRRIGRRPLPPGQPDSGRIFVDDPEETTILGAVKLTGKVGEGVTIGALSAFTDREEGFEETPAHVRSGPILFEPRASYNVVRVKGEILRRSSIGIMATSSFKQYQNPAFTGGVDWNLRTDNEMYGADGYLAGSSTPGTVGERLSGASGRLLVGKFQGQHWLLLSGYDFTTPRFDINEVGFFNLPTEHGGYTQVYYKEDRGESIVRRYALGGLSEYRWNWDGAGTYRTAELRSEAEFTNFWTSALTYIHEFRSYDDEERGIIGLYRKPNREHVTGTMQTDSRLPVVAALSARVTRDARGGQSLLGSLQLTLRPASWMEIAPSITASRTRSEEAWAFPLYSVNGFNIFGDRDVDQFDISVRGLLTFSKTMSLQLFTQLFLAKGKYTNYKELLPGSALREFNYESSSRFVDPSFNRKVINANVVFRWEYLPGSTLYLVWTQSRYGDNGLYALGFGSNMRDAFALPADNVLLAKLTYWWNL